MAPTPHLLLRASFDDFDVFGEATRGWDLETILLSPGLSADLLQFIDPTSRFHLTRAKYRSRIRQFGSPPEGLLTFVVGNSPDFEMEWRRQPVTGFDIAVFPRGGELDAVVDERFDVTLLSFPMETVRSTAEALGYLDLAGRLSEAEVFRCRPEDVGALRARLRSTERSLGNIHRLRTSRPGAPLLESALLAIARGSVGVKPRADRLRDAAVRRAEEFILSKAHEVPSLADLCQAAFASERTLQVGFNERFGMSPNAFMKTVRLNGVRRSLVEAGTKSKVADVANAWGFWHIGQLASDYRRMFHELPSETFTRQASWPWPESAVPDRYSPSSLPNG